MVIPALDHHLNCKVNQLGFCFCVRLCVRRLAKQWFYLRLQLSNYHHSHLTVWQIFSQKWTKTDCHFRENSWQYEWLMTKFQTFEWKLEFWKIHIHHYELDSFWITSGEINSDMDKYEFLLLYNEACHTIQWTRTQDFPNDQSMKFKMRLMPKHERHINGIKYKG